MSKEKSRNTKDLVNVRSIEDKTINNNKIGVISFLDKSSTVIISLKSINIALATQATADNVAKVLGTAFRNKRSTINVYSINQRPNINQTLEHYDKKLKSFKDELEHEDGDRAEALKLKSIFLEDSVEFFKELNNDSDGIIKEYYMTINSSGIKNSDFEDEVSNIIDTLSVGNLLSFLCSKNETVYVLQQIYDPYNKTKMDNYNHKSDVEKVIPNKIHFNIDCVRLHEGFASYMMIYDFPTVVNTGWLIPFASEFENVELCLNTSFLKQEEAKKLLSKTKRENIAEWHEKEKKNKGVEAYEKENELNLIDAMMEEVGAGGEQLRNTCVFIRITAPTKMGIIETRRKLKNLALNYDYRLDPLKDKQDLAYINFLPQIKKPIMEEIDLRTEISCKSLGNSFFASATSQRDITGHFIGFNESGDLVIYDDGTINQERINRNMFIIGTSGAGKSHFTKKIIKNSYLNGHVNHIIDVQKEYMNMVKKLGGQVVNTSSNNFSVNILQIFGRETKADKAMQSKYVEKKKLANLIKELAILLGSEPVTKSEFKSITKGVDELRDEIQECLNEIHKINKSEKENTSKKTGGIENAVLSHTKYLEIFLKLIDPSADLKMIRTVVQQINKFYAKKGINNETYKSIENDKWPVMEDFVKWLKPQLINTKTIAKIEVKRIEEFMVNLNMFCGESGQYKIRFGSHTTIDIDNSLICWECSGLISGGGQNTAMDMATIYTVFNFIENEVYSNASPDKQIYVTIDEAHNWIKEDYMMVLFYIEKMVREIRKFYGGVRITTQNILDFFRTEKIKTSSTAIMNNTQYQVFMKLKENDAINLQDVYKNSSIINSNDVDMLQSFPQGRAIMLWSSSNKMIVDVVTSQVENDLFEKGEV